MGGASHPEPGLVADSEQTVLLLRAVPELGEGLPLSTFDYLEPRLEVRAVNVEAGEWKAPWVPEPPRAAPPVAGLLVLRGLLIRSVRVERVADAAAGGSSAVELLGPGDLVRPWYEDEGELLRAVSSWQASDQARLAVIDERVLRVAGRWPALGATLLDRSLRRSRWLTMRIALNSAGTARERLVFVFEHLAERWGRVTAHGLAIPLPLTHRLLALLAGMTRPTCSSALSWLSRREVIGRETDGGWWMRPDAHRELTRLLGEEHGA